MRNLFYFAILSTVANIGILNSQSIFLSYIFYSLFFIGIDGLVYSLFKFSLYYVDLKINKQILLTVVLSIFSIDAFVMFINIFFHITG